MSKTKRWPIKFEVVVHEDGTTSVSQDSKVIPKPEYGWDRCMLEMAFSISKMSKDPSTKIGAVLVSPDKSKMTFGFNGFPRKIPDFVEVWNNRKESKEGLFSKYELVIHAEENAIMNAKCDLTDWTIYLTHPSCTNCAKKIIQTGIKRVVYSLTQAQVVMDLGFDKVSDMFAMAHVEFTNIPFSELKFGI